LHLISVVSVYIKLLILRSIKKWRRCTRRRCVTCCCTARFISTPE